MRGFVRIAFSAALLAVLFWRFGTRDVFEPMLRAKPGLFLAAFVVYCLSQVLSAARWMWLSRGVGFDLDFRRATKLYFVGMFFGIVVPSTLGSDAYRAFHLGRRPPGRAFALSTVIFDRLVGLLALVLVAIAAIRLGPSEPLPAKLVTGVNLIGVALVAGWFAAPLAARLLPEGNRWRKLVEADLDPYFRDPRLLATALGTSIVVHLMQVASQDLLVDSIHLGVPYGFVAIYHPLVSLAAAIPFTVGGFGLREAAYALLLPYAGIKPDDAVALGLLWWAIGALGGLLGGLVYMLRPEPAAPGAGVGPNDAAGEAGDVPG
ncbi:MAG: lysylphosphatidylglycerol synthase transmembrane domain-containing protein [Alphaproteobacteria bacterium]